MFVGVADSAMIALLEARAPDLQALAVEISLISAHSVWEIDGGEDCLAWLEADARRLAEAGQGPLFRHAGLVSASRVEQRRLRMRDRLPLSCATLDPETRSG
ncbi:MAG TPA: hypothetical protein VF535_10065 [Allosphingosinicella sp.]